MGSLTPFLDDTSSLPLYLQLYAYIRDAILDQRIQPGEKLPSLRTLSRTLKVSITTVELAYDQLHVEGYIGSKPQSGYFVNSISTESAGLGVSLSPALEFSQPQPLALDPAASGLAYYDPQSFDLVKWKKCFNAILNEHSYRLFQEGDPRGEAPLRHEIAKYIYQARGVQTEWEQIVIGAGTQQLLNLLCILLNRMGISHVSFEKPGYRPVRGIFVDRSFQMTDVPLDQDGIRIDKLPANIRSTVYVSPSNQFPTGSVMPVARRYALLDWALKNRSIIIEDDYNSELRYAGRPVPSLQGLDSNGLVVYLGSFSSTLFPSVKISYMVLPVSMHQLFLEVVGGYTQTCSKAEQLTLAYYMEKGYYQTGLKKLRKLYTQKIQIASAEIQQYASSQVTILSNTSGLHLLLELKERLSGEAVEAICQRAKQVGLSVSPIADYQESSRNPLLIFYYAKVPTNLMTEAIKALAKALSDTSNHKDLE